jgi:hypothetical protein
MFARVPSTFAMCVSLAAAAPFAIANPPADKSAVANVAVKQSFELVAPYWTAEGGWHTDLQLAGSLH